jgi:hypothetical protein
VGCVANFCRGQSSRAREFLPQNIHTMGQDLNIFEGKIKKMDVISSGLPVTYFSAAKLQK